MATLRGRLTSEVEELLPVKTGEIISVYDGVIMRRPREIIGIRDAGTDGVSAWGRGAKRDQLVGGGPVGIGGGIGQRTDGPHGHSGRAEEVEFRRAAMGGEEELCGFQLIAGQVGRKQDRPVPALVVGGSKSISMTEA